MTYRERRESKAARLTEWAEKREVRAAAVFEADKVFTTDHAFNTQPGHIPIREKVIAREARAFESLRKAREMSSRAAGIAGQLDHSIYSDDPDAIEQLEAKIARLEAEREQRKAANVAYRAAHKAELKTMTPYERSQAVPFPSYSIQNIGGLISTTRKRLEQLRKTAAAVTEENPRGTGRRMDSRYGGTCPDCGESFSKGDPIVYYRATREAVCGSCNDSVVAL